MCKIKCTSDMKHETFLIKNRVVEITHEALLPKFLAVYHFLFSLLLFIHCKYVVNRYKKTL